MSSQRCSVDAEVALLALLMSRGVETDVGRCKLTGVFAAVDCEVWIKIRKLRTEVVP